MRQQRLPRRDDLVNVLEFEDAATRALPAAAYSTIAGSDRAAFDRITLRPRMLVPTIDLDLSVDLFGDEHFTPIIVGPVADQRRYHADAELATVRGASAAKAAVIVSSGASVAIDAIAAESKTPLWFSVYADGGVGTLKQVQQAVATRCKVLCVTIGVRPAGPGPHEQWTAVAQIRKSATVPLVIKGVMTTEDTKRAIDAGAQGIVVSDHGGAARGGSAPIEVLPSIADVVAGTVTVLVDGSFRRGSDILKALILGARGVLFARPIMWGLAAYGADGVQGVIEMLQSDLGRQMGALGASNLESLTRSFVRIHRR